MEHENKKVKTHSSLYILMNYKKYRLYLFECIFVYFGYTLNETFLIDKIVELGGDTSDYGMAGFVLAIAEIPAAVWIVQLRKHFSIEKLMLAMACFATARAVATAFAPNITFLIGAQVFEIGALAIYYAAAVYLVQEYLPAEDVVKGVSFVSIASMGLGQGVAAFTSGILLEYLGVDGLLICSAVISAVAIIFAVLMNLSCDKTYTAG